MDVCPVNYKGDDSTGRRICVLTCPDIPDRYADLVLRICVDMCNSSMYGDPTTRNCVGVGQCPAPDYFSYQTTRRCVKTCPYGYFADNTTGVRKCQPSSSLCTTGFGDPFLRYCKPICTGPTPVDTFGTGTDCVSCNLYLILQFVLMVLMLILIAQVDYVLDIVPLVVLII